MTSLSRLYEPPEHSNLLAEQLQGPDLPSGSASAFNVACSRSCDAVCACAVKRWIADHLDPTKWKRCRLVGKGRTKAARRAPQSGRQK